MASVRRRPGTKQVRRSSKKVQHGGAKRASGKAGKMVYYFGQTKTEGDGTHARGCSAARAPTSPR
jgi:hypothetical protein